MKKGTKIVIDGWYVTYMLSIRDLPHGRVPLMYEKADSIDDVVYLIKINDISALVD